MSADLDKATTRNFLDGLRSFMATFDDQRDAAREDDAIALTESREHHTQAVLFGDLVQRLQCYSFVVLLVVILRARLAVFCKTLHRDHGLAQRLDDMEGEFLERVEAYITDVVGVQPPRDLWAWARDLVLLENCIGQAAGSVSIVGQRERRILQQIVRRRPGLSLEPDDLLFSRSPELIKHAEIVLVIETEFCSESVTAVQGLFGYLYQHQAPGGP
jgi:hypothetical protein